jgi:hypothetical protein
MSATALGTIAAIVVSFVSLYFAWRADQRAGRAEQRGERAESRGRRANIVVRFAGGETPGDPSRPRLVRLAIRNLGPATAHRLQLWLTDGAGQKVSSDMTKGEVVLVPDEPEQVGSVDVPAEARELQVWVSYTDDDGPHEHPLDVQLS